MRFAFMSLALALMASTAQAATVFKCVDEGGRTVFSDKRCDGKRESVELKDNRIGGSFSPSKEWIEQDRRNQKRQEIEQRYDNAIRQFDSGTCELFSSTTVRTLNIQNRVVAGMTRSDAIRSWGAPTRVNGSQYAYHWQRGGSSYFYIRDGCVTLIQGGYNG